MHDWFNIIAAGSLLSADNAQELQEVGFIIISGPVSTDKLDMMSAAYDLAVDNANSDDIGIGSLTTRISDFVNRGAEFDELYIYPPVLEACCQTIGRPFRLSTMLARTLRPRMLKAQELHVDFKRDALEKGYPMLGFIFMVDDFRRDNGATRFVPGSHKWPASPEDFMNNLTADFDNQVVACGNAGSMIIYNGSVWHGHTANLSDKPRRSIQGAYIRREAQSGGNLPERMQPETLARIGPLARYLINI